MEQKNKTEIVTLPCLESHSQPVGKGGEGERKGSP